MKRRNSTLLQVVITEKQQSFEKIQTVYYTLLNVKRDLSRLHMEENNIAT